MRWLRHLFSGAWQVRRVFPPHTMQAIEADIRTSEVSHQGEIRFAMEAGLDIEALLRGQSARARAIEVFSDLRVWDTEHNNGVLIYLLLADHDVEIVADRGIDARVGAAGWQAVCTEIEWRLRAGRFEEGIRTGIQAVSSHLARHYPARGGDHNELPDAPVIL
ncbi:MAG: TPM domain-containing protein [Gammaproteobacteria bacterium]|nr:TPM domain-containing protein [Gammaproteobacteria bacterium]